MFELNLYRVNRCFAGKENIQSSEQLLRKLNNSVLKLHPLLLRVSLTIENFSAVRIPAIFIFLP